MKKYSSSALLFFAIAVGSFATPLLLPDQYPLFLNSAYAQKVDIRNGYVWITLPSTGNQDDSWSCGPNSAARVLAFYGHRVDYSQVRAVSQRDKGIVPPKVCVGSGILRTCVDTSGFKTGFEPWELRDVMNRWEGGNAKYESGADFGNLKRLLSQGKPVLVLRRVGSFKPGRVFGTWPEMHWVAVHGFNDQERKIYYTETDDGVTYEKSYDEFLSEWDWSIGSGLASVTFRIKGVKPKTMVWVDRTLATVSQSQTTGSTSSVNQDNARSPVFDADFYLMTYADLRNAFGTNQGAAQNHWLTYGIKEGRTSSPAFDVRYYLGQHPDLQNAFGSSNYSAAINHWLTYGIKEGRKSHIIFDVRYYLGIYPDLRNAFGSSNYSAAVNHWLTYGVKEGRRGSSQFDPKFYLSNNPDVARAYGSNNYKGAIEHYLKYGIKEGRRGSR